LLLTSGDILTAIQTAIGGKTLYQRFHLPMQSSQRLRRWHRGQVLDRPVFDAITPSRKVTSEMRAVFGLADADNEIRSNEIRLSQLSWET